MKIKNYNSFIFEELEIKNPSKETKELMIGFGLVRWLKKGWKWLKKN